MPDSCPAKLWQALEILIAQKVGAWSTVSVTFK